MDQESHQNSKNLVKRLVNNIDLGMLSPAICTRLCSLKPLPFYKQVFVFNEALPHTSFAYFYRENLHANLNLHHFLVLKEGSTYR